MTGRGVQRAAGALCAVLLVCLAGCGTPPRVPVSDVGAPPAAAEPTQKLPVRTMELRLDGVDPCVLFTDAQRKQFGVNAGEPDDAIGEMPGRGCEWSNFPENPNESWLGQISVTRGAEYALGSSKPYQVVQIEGFSAVQLAALRLDSNRHCVELVDVALGQTLWVQYVNFSGDLPGISYEVACQKARDGAEAMLKTLRTLTS